MTGESKGGARLPLLVSTEPEVLAAVSYVVMARKYRPRRFDEVVGQEATATILKNAIRTGKVGHAYLFAGDRGVGKTSMARIFAKAINCVDPTDGEPCGQCAICTGIDNETCLDYIEIDAASNRKIEDIRDLRSRISIAPAKARYKVYVLDEVHMLTKEAANAFLKTLEEPPPHAKFILATTEPDKLPQTILSRCQRFDFRRIAPRGIVERLQYIVAQEGIELDPAVLFHVARRARGSMRDAESFLDQICAYGTEKVTVADVTAVFGEVETKTLADFITFIVAGDARNVLDSARSVLETGYDLGTFIEQFVGYLRDLMVLVVSGGENEHLFAHDEETITVLKTLAGAVTTEQVLYMVQLLGQFEKQMRYYADAEVMFMAVCVKLAQLFSEEAGSPLGASPSVDSPRPSDDNVRPGSSDTPSEVRPEMAELTPSGDASDERAELFPAPAEGSPPDADSSGETRYVRAEDARPRGESPRIGLDDIRSRWENALAEVASSVGGTARIALQDTQLVDFSNKVLTLGFGRDATFWRSSLDEAASRERVEDVLGKYYGFDFKIRCVTVDTDLGPGRETRGGKERPSQDKIVNRAVELFGGNLVDVVESRHV